MSAGTSTPPLDAAPGQSVARAPAPSLHAAIFAVQRQVRRVRENKKATIRSDKGSYQYGYADLGSVIDALDPAMVEQQLAFTGWPTISDGKPALRYKLTHVPSGESEEDTMLLLLDKENSQGHGSGITYARRYARVAVFDLLADEDDDGRANSPQTERNATDTVDLTAEIQGLSDEAINAALAHAGLEPVENPARLFAHVPAHYAEKIREGLGAVRTQP